MGTLRIVGGDLGGRRLAVPKRAGLRPTSERVREAIASALEARDAVRGANVLDLFAGTGALAFEALSRGAARATLVDRDRRLVRELEHTARALELGTRARSHRLDLLGDAHRVTEALASEGPFSLVFADPPYDHIDAVPTLLEALAAADVLTPGAWVVIEHAAGHPPGRSLLASVARYRYGDTGVEVGVVPPQARGDTDT